MRPAPQQLTPTQTARLLRKERRRAGLEERRRLNRLLDEQLFLRASIRKAGISAAEASANCLGAALR